MCVTEAWLLLLLNKGRTIPQISKIIDVRTRTIYTWLDNWELKGITALMTRKGQGLKSKLSPKEEKNVELVKKNKIYARSLKRACIDLSKELGFTLTSNMLKSFLKKLGYTWKRFKKSLKSKQNPIEYEAKKPS